MRARGRFRHALPVSGHMMTSPRLREVHERLVRLGTQPVSDADGGWQELRRRLPDRPLSRSERVMAWLRRPAVAIMTTGLLSTGVAHAAGVQPVRGGVDWLVGGVTSIVGAKNDEPRVDREARPHQAPSGSREHTGSFEENRRRLTGGGGGVEPDQKREPGGDGRGRAPAPAGAGSRGGEDRDEPRDDDRDSREREDDDGDEREDRDDDDERRPEPEDDELEERDDEEAEERHDEELEDDPIDGERGNYDKREDLESDAYDGVEREEDRD